MATIPIVEIHIERIQKDVTMICYGQDPELGLSIPVGDFVTTSWHRFTTEGFTQVAKALIQYRTPQLLTGHFHDLSKQELCEFFKKRFSFLISERNPDLWWIDLMKVVPDGSGVVSVGPQKRCHFQPNSKSTEFISVLESFIV